MSGCCVWTYWRAARCRLLPLLSVPETSGHYWAATQVSKRNLNLIKATSLSWYDSSDEARRGFCSVCGSSMFYERKGIDKISVSAGSLEIPTSLDRMRHIYVTSKGDYYDISDDLPQFEEYWPKHSTWSTIPLNFVPKSSNVIEIPSYHNDAWPT